MGSPVLATELSSTRYGELAPLQTVTSARLLSYTMVYPFHSDVHNRSCSVGFMSFVLVCPCNLPAKKGLETKCEAQHLQRKS